MRANASTHFLELNEPKSFFDILLLKQANLLLKPLNYTQNLLIEPFLYSFNLKQDYFSIIIMFETYWNTKYCGKKM